MSLDASGGAPVLELGPEPGSVSGWARSLVQHREVLVAMAGKDFKVRYKRATFGVLWAVALPMLQAAVMIVVFGRVARFGEGLDYTGYVLAGMVAWGYVGSTVPSAATAIVDGASLTDKVWFPRALLVLSPVLANLIGLAISLGIVTLFQLVRQGLGVEVLLLLPGTALLVLLVSGLCLTAAALQVEFRDIRFLVQAGLMVLFYATPILYPAEALGDLAEWLRVLNPFVGAAELFQAGLSDATVHASAVGATVAWTVTLLLIAVRLHRRGDRLFVDLL